MTCTRCDDTGYVDYAGFAMDPCDHSFIAPRPEPLELESRYLERVIQAFESWVNHRLPPIRAGRSPANPPEVNMSDAIHPAPREFSADQLQVDPILRYFHYSHLPEKLQGASKPFCDLAGHIVETLPRNPERTVALRKLLEAKDAAVRANVQ